MVAICMQIAGAAVRLYQIAVEALPLDQIATEATAREGGLGRRGRRPGRGRCGTGEREFQPIHPSDHDQVRYWISCELGDLGAAALRA